jgi:DNA-binding beta-propeller fold protein YncE
VSSGPEPTAPAPAPTSEPTIFPLPKKVATISVGPQFAGTQAIVVGEGSAWAGSALGPMARIDLSTNESTPFSLTPDDFFERGASALVVGDGFVWAVLDDEQGRLFRIEPSTNQILGSIPVGRNPNDVAFAGGSLWVVVGGEGVVAQVDPATNAVTARVPVPGAARIAALGSEVYVTDGEGVTVIDPQTASVTRRFTLEGPVDAIASLDGNLWVGGTAGKSPFVHVVDPASGEVVQSVHLPEGPSALAAGPGDMWAVDQLNGQACRILPANVPLVTCVAAGPQPVAVTVGEGAVWVANHDDATVTRIEPA